MSNPVKALLRLLCASTLIMLVAAALNFTVDPLQLLRPARLFPAMYSSDSRMQDAGLIRSQEFDTVLMGTSLAIHFRQSNIDRLLGVRSLKLAMSGSNSHEQSFVIAAALERHPRRVIWELDDWIFRDAPEINADPYLPADLYRRNASGIAGYLLSGAIARESLWILARSIGPAARLIARLPADIPSTFSVSHVDDINSLTPDFDVSGSYNAENALGAYARITDPVRSSYLGEGYDYDAMVRNFESDAVVLIARHPEVEFDLYFPPYSILQWVAMRDASPATLKIVYDLSAYISRRLATFANVRLHDFRAIAQVTHNLDNYSDVIHHSPAVDLMLLSWLAADADVVDRSAPTASLDRLKAQVEAYRTVAIAQ